MPNLNEMNLFYIVLAIIGIPLLLGFLTEAGKDLWNAIRKKTSLSDVYKMCEKCGVKGDIVRILQKQDDLRKDEIPNFKTSIALLNSRFDNMDNNFNELKERVDKIPEKIINLMNLSERKK